MYLSLAQCALVLGALAAAAPSQSKYVLHEERSSFMPRSQLQARSKIAGRNVLPMRIGLAQRGLDESDDWLMDIAHPESPNYGKHWTPAQVNKAFAPTANTVQTVREWLVSAGIDESRITVSDNKGWLAFDAAVEEAEKLFRAQFYEHAHPSDEDKYTVGCDAYYLPEHVRDHIDYITPGVKHQYYKRQLLDKKAKAKRNSVRTHTSPKPNIDITPASIDAKVVPLNCSRYVIDADCLRALYGLPAMNINKKVNPNNALALFEQQEQTYSQADLNLFFQNYLPQIPQNTLPIDSPVDGAITIAPQNVSGGEAMLDLTIAYAIIYPQKVNYMGVDDPYYQDNYYYKGFGDTLLDALDGSFCTYSAFGQKGNNNTVDPVYPDPHEDGYEGPLQCGEYQPPKVISFSYGPGENIWPMNYELRQCQEWLKLALQGTTAVFASGDNGVAGQISSEVRDRTCLGENATIFAPGFPASCPYVLTVGATEIKPNVSGYSANPEEAVFSGSPTATSNYTSGSGFSNIWARPSYQEEHVKNYFKTVNSTVPYYQTTRNKNIGANGGVYNRKGRAVPDVSANGAWWHVYTEGRLGRTGGTSMSTPLFASIINLINEERLKAGKTTVGFLHPTLYAHPEAFHDITEGFADGCGYDVAFAAAPGWDPVTGLGTPKYEKLLEIFMSLP